ncbi:MAG: PepSY-associated TM helix domain-containing protein [Pirellulales bacterium]
MIPGFQPVFVDWPKAKPGRAPETLDLRGNLPWEFVQRHRVGVKFNIADGRVLAIHAPPHVGPGQRVHDSMMPLHFGDWGGLGIKTFYFVLGLLAAGLCFSGLWAWADRRSRQSGMTSGPSNWPRHVVFSICITGSLAIVAIPILAVGGIHKNLELIFFAAWAGLLFTYLAAVWLRRKNELPQDNPWKLS